MRHGEADLYLTLIVDSKEPSAPQGSFCTSIRDAHVEDLEDCRSDVGGAIIIRSLVDI